MKIIPIIFCFLCLIGNSQVTKISENPKVIIELKQSFNLGWEPVIEIKNCGSNRDMAIDVVEGLALVSLKQGRKPRTYRIVQKGFKSVEIPF